MADMTPALWARNDAAVDDDVSTFPGCMQEEENTQQTERVRVEGANTSSAAIVEIDQMVM